MIFIGIGSNEGDPQQNVLRSLQLLTQQGVNLLRCSSLYRTEPWGIREQNPFINAVAEVGFEDSAPELLKLLLAVEEEMGRIRRFKWGPRLIDLDLIEFHRTVIDEPGLQVPHPFYPERDFVLVPLAELEPDWIPTGNTQSVTQLIAALGPLKIEQLPGE